MPNAVVIHLDSWPIATDFPDINRFHFIVTVAQKRLTLDHIYDLDRAFDCYYYYSVSSEMFKFNWISCHSKSDDTQNQSSKLPVWKSGHIDRKLRDPKRIITDDNNDIQSAFIFGIYRFKKIFKHYGVSLLLSFIFLFSPSFHVTLLQIFFVYFLISLCNYETWALNLTNGQIRKQIPSQ